ncbi:MAG TPA: EamA family transporter [Gemmatimonadaceae bacterium]|nr:EamA family transporter [Gemmatimonadaceae bacterium]
MRARLLAAFTAVYVIWGSTYLAIRFAVETLPPLLMAGARFTIAGLLLLAWSRFVQRAQRPSRSDWRTGLMSGALLLLGGNGAVVWAETRVPSGIAALLVAVVPLWMVLLDWLRPGGRRPAAPVFVGLALGLVGLGLLVGPDALNGEGTVNPAGALVLMAGSLSWAVGSLLIKRAPRATTGLNGSGTQMLAGGLCLLAAGLALGELAQLDLAHLTGRSLIGFLYLVTFGSLIGFTAYFYLLAHTTAAKAATYAYVNPVVAVVLGWAFANEPLTMRTILAAAVILAGVAIITVTRDARAGASEERRAAA